MTQTSYYYALGTELRSCYDISDEAGRLCGVVADDLVATCSYPILALRCDKGQVYILLENGMVEVLLPRGDFMRLPLGTSLQECQKFDLYFEDLTSSEVECCNGSNPA